MTPALSAGALGAVLGLIQGTAPVGQTLQHLLEEHAAYFLIVPEIVIAVGAVLVFVLSTYLKPERDDQWLTGPWASLVAWVASLGTWGFFSWAEFPLPEPVRLPMGGESTLDIHLVTFLLLGVVLPCALLALRPADLPEKWRGLVWKVALSGAGLVVLLTGLPLAGGGPILDPGSPALYLVVGLAAAFNYVLFGMVRQRNWIPAMALFFQLFSIVTTFTIIHLTSRHFSFSLGQYWGGLETFDPFSIFWEMTIDMVAIFAILMAWNHPKIRENRGEFYALLMLASMALMFMVASSDLLAIYVMTEFSSIALYLLVGFARGDRRAPEAIAKYFLVGMLSGILILMSGALFYGLTGSTNLYDIRWLLMRAEVDQGLLSVALAFMAAGMGYKIAVAPFHQWFPDAVEGAPAPVGAFVSLAPKVAGFCVWMRIYLLGLSPMAEAWRPHLLLLAAVSMTLGNLAALRQTNVKRMLAYSSIAHVGFVLMAIVAAASSPTPNLFETDGFGAALFYLFVYVFMNAGAFAVVSWLEARGVEPTLAGFRGLASREPILAGAMVIFLASLAGIPPTAGFWAKLTVFLSAVPLAATPQAHLTPGFATSLLVLVVVAGVNTVIAVAYYFRLGQEMVFPRDGAAVAPSALAPRRAPAASTLAISLAIYLALAGNFLFLQKPGVIHDFASSMNIVYPRLVEEGEGP